MPVDQRLHIACLHASLAAKAGSIEARDVTHLLNLAAGTREDDPLRPAVSRFVERYAVTRRDPAALAETGAELGRALELSLRRDPPGQERSDIHG